MIPMVLPWIRFAFQVGLSASKASNKKSAARMNQTILDRSVYGTEIGFMVSPLLRTGVAVLETDWGLSGLKTESDSVPDRSAAAEGSDDAVYSHRQFTGRDKPFMEHHCGFTLKVLIGTLKANGFQAVAGIRRPAVFDLWVVAINGAMTDAELRIMAGKVLPGLA